MKLAFCFLSYDDIEQHVAWNSFFRDVSSEKFTVVVHMKNHADTSIITGSRVIPTMPTEWGGFSLVKVQQALMEEACKDESVTKCILLSGDSIPLHPFDVIYNKLCSDDKGYIHINEKNDGRDRIAHVNRKAWPRNRPWIWAKASQWCILNRSHVKLLSEQFDMLTKVFLKSEVPDEHLYPIFFISINAIHTFHNSITMYVNWLRNINVCRILHHSSPVAYHTINFNAKNIDDIYASGALFMRKICQTSKIKMDWTADRPLQIVSHVDTQFTLPYKRNIFKRNFFNVRV